MLMPKTNYEEAIVVQVQGFKLIQGSQRILNYIWRVVVPSSLWVKDSPCICQWWSFPDRDLSAMSGQSLFMFLAQK